MAGGLAVVAMVRDEADVIELFVRINARSVDHLYLIDHDSRDTTRELLMRLRSEGLPLSLLEENSQQRQVTAEGLGRRSQAAWQGAREGCRLLP